MNIPIDHDQVMTADDEMVHEGKIEGSRQILLRQGIRRFGTADTGAQFQLENIRDIERLGRMADAIFTAKTWQEWLAIR